MLKEHATIFRRLTIAADILLVSGCFFGSYAIIDRSLMSQPFFRYFEFLPVILVVWVGLLYHLGMYRSFRTHARTDILIILIQTVLFSYVLVGWTAFMLNIDYVPRPFLTLTFLSAFLVLLIEKMILLSFFRRLRRKGFNYRSILLVGTGPRAQKFLRHINTHRDFGLNVRGVIDDAPRMRGESVEGYAILGSLCDIPDIVHRTPIDEAVFIVPRSWLDRIEPAMRFLETEGIKTHLAVDHFNLRLARMEFNVLFDFPLITFAPVRAGEGQLLFKRLLDLLVAGGLLVLLSPLFFVIALVIRLTSPGPVLFRQERCTLNGRRFTLFKFRTMAADAESKLSDVMAYNQMSGPTFKMENDPRLTQAGRFLRKFSLDELPQLWNVLWGDMSLVGPRPPLPKEVEQYDSWQRRRLSMRPGITCLWQVQGRSNITNFDDWMRLDLKYIDEWSFWLDIKICLETIPAVLFGVGAK